MSYGLTARDDGGYRHVLRVALPLVLSMSSATIMSFVDRMFLGWYSTREMGAALTGGITYWTSMSLFTGTASYVSTFVAQYHGAEERSRVSVAVWQGLFFAVAAGAIVCLAGFNASFIMGLTGHAPDLVVLESAYYRILAMGAVLPLVSSALGGFYSGLGRTGLVMCAEIAANVVNFVLDYCMIFGRFGFPEWGIRGAAVATVIGAATSTVFYAAAILFGRLGREYAVLRAPHLDAGLFWRLLRYGVPNGLGWTIDAASWTFFVWMVGRIGERELQALSVTFAINHIAFLPMIGFSAATSILVGQFVGAGKIDGATRSTRSSFAVTITYMTAIGAVFVLLPGPLARLFAPQKSAADFAAVVAMATVLLRFVAFYSIFDSGNLIFSAALKGAGDTRFTMVMGLVLSAVVLVVPTYLAVEWFDAGMYTVMAFGTAYVVILAAAFYLRYRAGAWKTMRVIEQRWPAQPRLTDGPMVDA